MPATTTSSRDAQATKADHPVTRHQLGGHIGTDPNFSMATHTGTSKPQAKATDPQPTMKLTQEEQDIHDGKKGDVLQKAIKDGRVLR